MTDPLPSMGAVRHRTVIEREATYHDLLPIVGLAGIGLTWSDGRRVTDAYVISSMPAQASRWSDPVVAWGGRSTEDSPKRALLELAAFKGDPDSDVEDEALAAMLPDSLGPAPGPWALPPGDGQSARVLAEQRAAARAAIAAATGIPDDMRAALHARLDAGHWRQAPRLAWIRRATNRPEWDVLGFASKVPLSAPLLNDARMAARLLDRVPVAEAFSATFPGLTQAHMRRLAALGPEARDACARMGLAGCRDAAGIIAALPPDWVPREGEWRDFAVASRTAMGIGRAHLRDGFDPATLLRGAGQGWPSLVERIRRETPNPNAMPGRPGPEAGSDEWRAELDADLEIATHGLHDTVGSAARQLVLPLIARRMASLDPEAPPLSPSHGADGEGSPWVVAYRAAPLLLLDGLELPAALAVSARWHRRVGAMSVEIRGGATTDWPALLAMPWRQGDIEIASLADTAALTAEGSADPDADGMPGLDHCVATREDACLTGEGHVLSVRRVLRDGRRERLSTAEVAVWRRDDDGEGLVVHLTQHRGLRNADPSPEATAALASLIEALSDGSVAAAAEALDGARRPPPDDEVEASCGFDWRDGAAMARAVSAWRPVLPRWARDLGPDALLEAMRSRGVLDEDFEAHVATGPRERPERDPRDRAA